MNYRLLSSVVSCLAVTFALAGAAVAQAEPEQTEPEQTEPEQTQPEAEPAEVSPPPAEQAESDASEDDSIAGKTRLDLSVGLKGGVAMSAVTEVPNLNSEQRIEYGQGNDDSGYFGAFGVGPGVGLSLEARVLEIIGLETGFYYTLDDATGWLDKNDANTGATIGRVHSDQDTSALHIPVLFKLVADTDLAKPFFGLGFEFVLQQSSSIDYRTDDGSVQPFADMYNERNTITTSNYTMLQLTTGVELDFGEIRVPIELRGGYNLGFDDQFAARVEPEQQADGSYEFVYDGEYLGHFGFFVGVMYDYDLYF